MFGSLGAIFIYPAQSSLESKKTNPVARSNAPHIYLVEIANDKNQHYFNVHFETLANKRYTVQASNVLPAAATNWVDVLVVPPFPFANHYIYTEKYTNMALRYFRLKMQ